MDVWGSLWSTQNHTEGNNRFSFSHKWFLWSGLCCIVLSEAVKAAAWRRKLLLFFFSHIWPSCCRPLLVFPSLATKNSLVSLFYCCSSGSPWTCRSSTSPLIDFSGIMKNELGFQMAHLAGLLSRRPLLYLQHIKKREVLLMRSDGLRRPKPPAFDSWPLIRQFITGEFKIFGRCCGKTQHIKI